MTDTPEKKLEKLFDLSLDALIEKVENNTASSADMANIRNILRDNNISCANLGDNSKPSKLKNALPDLPEDPNIISLSSK